MDDFSDETKQELVDTFPEYVTDKNKFKIPEFQLIHHSIVGKGSHGKSETKAFRVQIERQHSKVFKHVMELAFAKTPVKLLTPGYTTTPSFYAVSGICYPLATSPSSN
jgi:hypothetical protein